MADNKTITSQKAAEVAQNPVVNPPVHQDPEFIRAANSAEVQGIKKNEAELTMDDILTDAVTVVDTRIPNFLDAQPRDRTWVFQWKNRSHDGEGGNRYQQMKAQGWVNVESVDEIDGPISKFITTKDGAIVYQDVILMKMRRGVLYGMYKANMLKSNKMFNPVAIHEAARNEGNKALQQELSGTPRSAYAGKVGIFVPGSNDIPGSVGSGGDNTGSHQAR